jgi:hypothetical protein
MMARTGLALARLSWGKASIFLFRVKWVRVTRPTTQRQGHRAALAQKQRISASASALRKSASMAFNPSLARNMVPICPRA